MTASSQETTGSISMVLKITSKSSWAGYIASGSNIASVSGTITVPTHSYVGYWPNVDYILYWVGIGGFSSNSKGLWQAGVQEQVNSDNSDSIDVWYEETTKSGGPVVYHNFTGGIDQGAQIIVDLSVSSGISYFSVGYWNYVNLVWWNGSVSFTPDQTTAEWVEEAWGGGQYMIPDVRYLCRSPTHPIVSLGVGHQSIHTSCPSPLLIPRTRTRGLTSWDFINTLLPQLSVAMTSLNLPILKVHNFISGALDRRLDSETGFRREICDLS